MVKVISTGGLSRYERGSELYAWDEPKEGPTKAEVEERLRKNRERVRRQYARKLKARKGKHNA